MNRHRDAFRVLLTVVVWTFSAVAIVAALVGRWAESPEWNWIGVGVMVIALLIAIPASHALKRLRTTVAETHDI